MTVEEIYIKLKDELSAENEISASPERIFIKNEEHTICTLGMNRSHEIIFVEFKPASKDLSDVQREGFVHPHPVEMLHDAGWRQAQITMWEEAERLIGIINRSYKKKKKPSGDDLEGLSREQKLAAIRRRHVERLTKRKGRQAKAAEKEAAAKKKAAPVPAKPAAKKAKPAAKPKAKPVAKPKAKPAKKKEVKKAKPVKKVAPKPKAKPTKKAKKEKKKAKKKR
jgi:hypothetical protein